MKTNGTSRNGWGWIAGLACLWAVGAMAESEASLEASVDVDVVSAYVWRGQVLNDRAVVQPGLTASTGGFTVNAWSSMNLDGTDTDGEFTEMDWTVSYARELGPTAVELGVVQYTFPNSTLENEDGTASAYPGTIEVFVSAGLPDVPLGPSVTVSYDVDEIEGLYAVASIGHSFELMETVSLDLSASLGFGDKDYNAGYFGHDQAALNDLLVGVALPISITENFSLTPSLSYMMLPDSDLKDAAEAAYGEKDSVYGGVTLSLAF